MWVFDPDSGGRKIPERVKRDVQRTIEQVAEKHFKGKYTRLDIRFRGQFCYIDAYTEPPQPAENWPPKDWPETPEEYLERLRNTPTHLCRLRYFDDDRWGYAFYTYSHEKYELSVYPDGEFFGRPEEAFLEAAGLYLS
ncbi:MAG: hypothetical protein HY784_02420 [Chloroflexi bacterium]|nr:hypothetical protein [Chloroflexota bacterium]